MSRIPLTGWGELQDVASIVVCDRKMAGRFFAPLINRAVVLDALACKPGGGVAGEYQILAGPVLDNTVVMNQATQIVLASAYDWETAKVVFLLIKLTNCGDQLVRNLQKLNAISSSAKVLVGWDNRRKRHSVCYSPSTSEEKDALVSASWPDLAKIIRAVSDIAFSDIEELAQANHKIRAALAEEQRRAAKRAELRTKGIFLREPSFPPTKALPPMLKYVRP